MSGMLNKNILKALYRANFEKITAYILDICELIVEDYERKLTRFQVVKASAKIA